jgi:hypothetical protein
MDINRMRKLAGILTEAKTMSDEEIAVKKVSALFDPAGLEVNYPSRTQKGLSIKLNLPIDNTTENRVALQRLANTAHDVIVSEFPNAVAKVVKTNYASNGMSGPALTAIVVIPFSDYSESGEGNVDKITQAKKIIKDQLQDKIQTSRGQKYTTFKIPGIRFDDIATMMNDDTLQHLLQTLEEELGVEVKLRAQEHAYAIEKLPHLSYGQSGGNHYPYPVIQISN